MANQSSTLRAAGYARIGMYLGGHILRNLRTGEIELWNKNFGSADATLVYGRTRLEFCNVLTAADIEASTHLGAMLAPEEAGRRLTVAQLDELARVRDGKSTKNNSRATTRRWLCAAGYLKWEPQGHRRVLTAKGLSALGVAAPTPPCASPSKFTTAYADSFAA